jgi:hypothetical protein
MATKAKTSIYDDNQFAIHRQTRHEKITGAKTRRRGHFPLWLDAILILIVVAAAGSIGFVLTHPSPHRSAEGIATDFVHQVGDGDYLNASKDVEPAEQATALAALRSQAGIPNNPSFSEVHTTQFGSETGSGTTAMVIIKSCNSSLACNPLPAIPCQEVDGKWYVAWGLFLQMTATG